MNKELYVSSTPHETRLALVEDGETAEVYIEREKEFSLAGAIFKGRVTRVLPGMQSAFVDIGLERDAFLYVSDFFEDSEEYDRVVSEAENAVDRLEARPPERFEAPSEPAAAAADEPATVMPAGASGGMVEPVFSNATASQPPSDDPASGDGRADPNRQHRRGRHRRRGGRQGIPDAKFARPGAEESRPARTESRDSFPESLPAPAPVARPADIAPRQSETGNRSSAPAAPAAYAPMILPGESLAKYRDRPPQPATAATVPAAPSLDERTLPAGESDEIETEIAESSLASGYPEPLAADRDIDSERRVFEHERSQSDSPRHAGAVAIEPPVAGANDNAPAGRPRVGGGLPPLSEALVADDDDEEQGTAIESGDEFGDRDASAAASALEMEGEESEPAAGEPGDNASASQRETPPQARMQARTRSRRRRRHSRGHGAPSESAAPAAPPAPVAEPAEVAVVERSQPRLPAPVNGGARLIGDLLHAGQEILIQVSKEPLGKKGARITSHLALPGRFLVYMPTVRHIGVSRKIGSDAERARLKRIILENTKDLSGGFIVRTAGAGASDEEFKADIRLLANLWNDIRAQFEKARAPATLHHDLNLVERTLRDQLSDEFTHIWVDTDDQYQRVVKFISYFMPQLVDRVRLYTRDVPLFEHYGIQEEIDKALKSKVWLKSGGYIVLNQTEALVAIDVNTGKFVGKSNRLEDTIVKTNVDAIKEIVRQIRLRDLGGIIVIDFIDMDERRNRQRVMQALEEAMRSDRAPSKVLSFNDFGLVALTRKRVKQSLERTLGCACPYCAGVGLVKSPITVCNEIYSEVRKVAPSIERDDIVLRVNPEVGRALKAQGAGRLKELEELTGKAVSVRSDPQVHQEQFEIY